MKIFILSVVAMAAAAAAPAEEPREAPRDKRGIFGEPGGLLTPHVHHDSLLGSHLHAPLHSSLHAPLLSSSGLHHHDLHDHAILHDLHDLHHHAPVISSSHLHAPVISSSHLHAPVLHHDFLHHDFHHDLHHHDLHHAPLLLPHHHHVAPSVIRIVKTVRAPPTRHIIRSGW